LTPFSVTIGGHSSLFVALKNGMQEQLLETMALNLQYHLDVTKGLPSKRLPLRELLIMPFISLLHGRFLENGLPLNRMMASFFDWVGVEQKYRPTDAGIRTIVREYKKRAAKHAKRSDNRTAAADQALYPVLRPGRLPKR
jgi:hypothetical protein